LKTIFCKRPLSQVLFSMDVSCRFVFISVFSCVWNPLFSFWIYFVLFLDLPLLFCYTAFGSIPPSLLKQPHYTGGVFSYFALFGIILRQRPYKVTGILLQWWLKTQSQKRILEANQSESSVLSQENRLKKYSLSRRRHANKSPTDQLMYIAHKKGNYFPRMRSFNLIGCLFCITMFRYLSEPEPSSR